MNTTGFDESRPCRGGLPFFKLTVSNVTGLGDCFRFCTSMGVDLFGVASHGTECRCGASAENSAVWGKHAEDAKRRGLQVNTASLHENGKVCDDGIEIYQYSAWLENDALGTRDLLSKTPGDDRMYMQEIISGPP